jgi:hypothetical protein
MFCVLGHLSEAKFLVDDAGIDSPKFHGEFSRLLAWVEYHMVVSRFSLRHWHTNVEPIKSIRNSVPAEQEACLSRKVSLKNMKNPCPHNQLSDMEQVKGVSFYSHEILRYLYIAFEIIQKPTSSLYHSDEYESSLRCIENRITTFVPSGLDGISDSESGLSTAWVAMIELFRIAALIYLKRASRNFSRTSAQIDTMAERAYALLDHLETFNPTFPLLIVGCEARTDTQRMRILEHIEKAMQTSSLRSLYELRNILQQIWVQDDLAVDYEPDYLNRLDAVISSYQIMPSFA